MQCKKQIVVQVRRLTKIYPGDVTAVSDVSFEVAKGEVVAVLGPSGAGKSTLLRCMNRLITKTHGQVLINKKDITQCRGKRCGSCGAMWA